MSSYAIIDIGEIVQEATGQLRSEQVLEKIVQQLENCQLDPERVAKINMQFNTSKLCSPTLREQRILWQGMMKFTGSKTRAFNLLYHEDDHFGDRMNVSVLLWEVSN